MSCYINDANLDPETKKVLQCLLDDIGRGSGGSVPAAVAQNVSARETGSATMRSTVLTLTRLPLTVRDTEQGGGVKIYTFPLGKLVRLGASATLSIATTSALASTLNSGVSCRAGVGTTTQANATLATTEQDIVQVTTWTSGTTIDVPVTAFRCDGAASVTALDMTTTADAYLNISVPGATDIDADATVSISGTIIINWARS